MKHLLLSALLLAGLASCEEHIESTKTVGKDIPTASSPTYQLSLISFSLNLVMKGADYTGVILHSDTTTNWDFGLTKRTVTPTEVGEAEAILHQCANEKLVTWTYYHTGIDSLEGLQGHQAHCIAPLANYARQYIGLRTANGQRVVWINAFPPNYSDNWQTSAVYVDDGGRAFFNIYINLDTKQCFNFIHNAEG